MESPSVKMTSCIEKKPFVDIALSHHIWRSFILAALAYLSIYTFRPFAAIW